MNPAGKNARVSGVKWVPVAMLIVAITYSWGFSAGAALAGPTRILAPQFTEPVQLWADSAKAPTPTSTVVVRKGTCGLAAAAMACAYYDPMTATGTITMMPGLTGVGAQKIFLHELGHVFDGRHFYPSDRLEVTRLLGFPAATLGRTQVDPSRHRNGLPRRQLVAIWTGRRAARYCRAHETASCSACRRSCSSFGCLWKRKHQRIER